MEITTNIAPLTAFGWQGVVLLVWVGLAVGSFLNVVIYRLPVMLERQWRSQATDILTEAGATVPDQKSAAPFNLLVPRSRCPHCEHAIGAWENIPVISWLVLRGKCKSCQARISFRYPAIELLTCLLTVAVIAAFGFSWLAAALCVFTWILVAATFIDFDTTLLPDQLTYPLLWLGLLTNTFLNGIVPLTDAVVGAAFGYLALWTVYWVFKLLTGKEGMGYGDFKLLAALGAWLGWQVLPSIILIAALLGLIYAGITIIGKRQSSAQPIAFGPYLAAAGWVAMMWRDSVVGLFTLGG